MKVFFEGPYNVFFLSVYFFVTCRFTYWILDLS
jgi:hypothetical protein